MNDNHQFKYPSTVAIKALKLIAFVISKPVWFVRFRGKSNIPRSGEGYIIASNHQTYVDPVWITLPVHQRLRFMAFETAFSWRFLGPFIRYLGAFPVSLDGSRSKDAYRNALRSLSDGAALVIFPEGAREFADGEPLDFKEGAMRIAIRAGVAVLPVTVRGGNEVWPQKRKYPRLFRRIEIIYHPPYKPASNDAAAETERLKGLIAADL